MTRSTIQAPAPVTNASNAGGDIATTIRNAATDGQFPAFHSLRGHSQHYSPPPCSEQIEELGRLVDNLSQTFAQMSVLVKSFKK